MSGAGIRRQGRHPRPHSYKWLDALRQVNPRQAAHAAAVVRLAGRGDVCSVCGDRPARDYDDADPPYRSIRLCDDCRGIQTIGFGARLTLRADPTGDAE